MQHTAIALGVHDTVVNAVFPKFTSADPAIHRRARGWVEFSGKDTETQDLVSMRILVYGKMHPAHTAAERLQSRCVGSSDWFFGTQDTDSLVYIHFFAGGGLFLFDDREVCVKPLCAAGRKVFISDFNPSESPCELDLEVGTNPFALAGEVAHQLGEIKVSSLHFVLPPSPYACDKLLVHAPNGSLLGTLQIDAGMQHMSERVALTGIAERNKFVKNSDPESTPDFSPVSLAEDGSQCIGVTPFVQHDGQRTHTLRPRVALPDPMFSCSM